MLDIQALVSRYGYVLDNGAEGGHAYADLFTDDGVFASPQATVTGREALLKFASGHRPGQGPAYVRNFAINMMLEPAPEGARGRCTRVVIAIGENNQPSSVFTGGHFEDIYTKTSPAGGSSGGSSCHHRAARRATSANRRARGALRRRSCALPAPHHRLPSRGGEPERLPRSRPRRSGVVAEDRIEIQQLVARYAYALDTGGRNGYDYADLFAPDGVFVGMNQGRHRPLLPRPRHAGVAGAGRPAQPELRQPLHHQRGDRDHGRRCDAAPQYAIIGISAANGSTDGNGRTAAATRTST